jgi:hypothetical protein
MIAQPINAGADDAKKVQQAMSSLLYQIEEAAGLEHNASRAIGELDKENRQYLYDSVGNQEKFVDSVNEALNRIESAKGAPGSATLEVQGRSAGAMLSTISTTPYPPNYPPTWSAAYNIAATLGLTSSNEDRCDGLGLEIYQNAFYAAEKTADVGDGACSFFSCDPFGPLCAGVCGFVEAYKLAVLVARIPIDSCNQHNEGVDAAEIEAGYENGVLIINDLANVLENQKDFLENQEEIIKLLKTPPGKRPGWNGRKIKKK